MVTQTHKIKEETGWTWVNVSDYEDEALNLRSLYTHPDKNQGLTQGPFSHLFCGCDSDELSRVAMERDRHSQLLCSTGGSFLMGCAWWQTSSSSSCKRGRCDREWEGGGGIKKKKQQLAGFMWQILKLGMKDAWKNTSRSYWRVQIWQEMIHFEI